MASSGRYQSRLLNFVDRQVRHWRDRGAVAWRSVQTTLSWTAQILLYPLYVVVQASRQLQGQAMGATPQLTSPEPDLQGPDLNEQDNFGRGNPPVVAPNLAGIAPNPPVVAPNPCNERDTLGRGKSPMVDPNPPMVDPNPPVVDPDFAGITPVFAGTDLNLAGFNPNSAGFTPVFPPAIPLAQVRGIACDRQSRKLILIDRQNQPLALNPELQPRSLQQIVLGLSTWSYARQPQALPWVLQGLVRVSDRRQWQGINQWLKGWVEWMATREVAIAAHLFQESLDRPPAPVPALPDRPWATTLDALDPQARPLVAPAGPGANSLDLPVYRLPASFRPSLQSLARGALTPVDFFDRRWALWESRVQQSGALVPWVQGWQRVGDRVLPQLEPLQQWLDRRFFGHWIPPLPQWDVLPLDFPRSGPASRTATTSGTSATTAVEAISPSPANPAHSSSSPSSPSPAALFLSPNAQVWLDTFFDVVNSVDPVDPLDPLDPGAKPIALPPSSLPTHPLPVPLPHPDLAFWDWPGIQLENSAPRTTLASSSSPNFNAQTPSPQEPWHSWPLTPSDDLDPDRPYAAGLDPDRPYAADLDADRPYADRPYAAGLDPDRPYADRPYAADLDADRPYAADLDPDRPYAAGLDADRPYAAGLDPDNLTDAQGASLAVPHSPWPDPLPPDSASIAPSAFSPAADDLDWERSWLETPAVPVGYEQHPLERLLNWLDRGLAWVENAVQNLLQRLLRGRLPR